MSTRAACTIVAGNYLAQASVLRSSLGRVHPEVGFTTLVVDAGPADLAIKGVGRVLRPGDLGIPPTVLRTMIAIYDVMELSTALKPFLLRKLLAEGATSAAYVDPDIEFYDRIDEAWEGAERAGFALTPHVLAPYPDDGLEVGEREVMLAGIFNLGFIAVSPAADGVLTWWGDRLRTQAISDPWAALFTDQRWIDWVPGFADPYVSRDPGLNVAHWNLHERPIARSADAWTAAGQPLRFFHFSGHDPATPWVLTKHATRRPRTLLSDHPDLVRLFAEYDARLQEARLEFPADRPYGHLTLSTGLRPDAAVRRFYRKLVIGEVAAPTRPSLDPEWWAIRQFGTAVAPLSAIEVSWWESRSDLQSVFPDPLGRDARRFRDWSAADPATIDRRDAVRVPGSTDDPPLSPGDEVWRLLTDAAPGTDERDLADLVAASMRADGNPVVVVDGGPVRDLDHAASTAAALAGRGPLVVDAARHPAGRIGFPLPEQAVAAVLITAPVPSGSDVDELAASARQVWTVGSTTATPLPPGHGRVVGLRVPIPERVRPTTTGTARFGCDARLGGSDPVLTALIAYLKAVPEPFAGSRLLVDVTGLPVIARERVLRATAERPDIVAVDELPGVDVYLDLRVPSGFALRPLRFAVSGSALVTVDHPITREHLSPIATDLVPIGDDGQIDTGHVVRVIRAFLDHPGRVERRSRAAREHLLGAAAAPSPVEGAPEADARELTRG